MPDVRAAVRTEVRRRARYRCEYCLVPESLALVGHEIDHIIAAKHGGGTSVENLALCCALCNRHKGSDLVSIDPETGATERLFHPRRDSWHEHFELSPHFSHSADRCGAGTRACRVETRLDTFSQL